MLRREVGDGENSRLGQKTVNENEIGQTSQKTDSIRCYVITEKKVPYLKYDATCPNHQKTKTGPYYIFNMKILTATYLKLHKMSARLESYR